MAQSQTRFLHVQRVTPNVIRSIFDSCYLRPEENPSCVNYHDPAKASIMEDATRRQEAKLAADAASNKLIDDRIASDTARDLEIQRQREVIHRQNQQLTRE